MKYFAALPPKPQQSTSVPAASVITHSPVHRCRRRVPFCVFGVIFPTLSSPPRVQRAQGNPSFPLFQLSHPAPSSLGGLHASWPLALTALCFWSFFYTQLATWCNGITKRYLYKAIKIQNQGKKINSWVTSPALVMKQNVARQGEPERSAIAPGSISNPFPSDLWRSPAEHPSIWNCIRMWSSHQFGLCSLLTFC